MPIRTSDRTAAHRKHMRRLIYESYTSTSESDV